MLFFLKRVESGWNNNNDLKVTSNGGEIDRLKACLSRHLLKKKKRIEVQVQQVFSH